jgi:hypothetical protein
MGRRAASQRLIETHPLSNAGKAVADREVGQTHAAGQSALHDAGNAVAREDDRGRVDFVSESPVSNAGHRQAIDRIRDGDRSTRARVAEDRDAPLLVATVN